MAGALDCSLLRLYLGVAGLVVAVLVALSADLHVSLHCRWPLSGRRMIPALH